MKLKILFFLTGAIFSINAYSFPPDQFAIGNTTWNKSVVNLSYKSISMQGAGSQYSFINLSGQASSVGFNQVNNYQLTWNPGLGEKTASYKVVINAYTTDPSKYCEITVSNSANCSQTNYAGQCEYNSYNLQNAYPQVSISPNGINCYCVGSGNQSGLCPNNEAQVDISG